MKIQRVIRFKKIQDTEDVKADLKKGSANTSPSDLEEYTQPENDISDEELQSQGVKESGPSAFNQLKRAMEMVLSGRHSNNMIGVFGINADTVIEEMEKDSICYNINILGKIEPSPTDDIYNHIAAILLDYLGEETRGRRDLDFETKEVYSIIESIYDLSYDYDFAIPLEALHRNAMRAKRDNYILTAINRINRIANYSSFSRDRENKFLLIVELRKADYKTFSMLSKLQSSELIIIVYSLFELEYVVDSETMRKMGGKYNIIGKFFPVGNYIVANEIR